MAQDGCQKGRNKHQFKNHHKCSTFHKFFHLIACWRRVALVIHKGQKVSGTRKSCMKMNTKSSLC